MKLIETKTLGAAAASIEFTSIPQTFTDLVILSSCRSDRNDPVDIVIDGINVHFNGVTTGFSHRNLAGDGSSASSSSATNGRAGISNALANTANTFGNSICYIPNYTAATNKSFSADGVAETNATASFQFIYASLWENTAAITSVKLLPGVGPNWIAGSTFSLYGITKGSDGIVTTS
jgi:hypothetical protein